MNNVELFVLLGHISAENLSDAEALQRKPPVSAAKRTSYRRTLLVAAAIMLALLLVGCAVSYALRLQDLSIGKEPQPLDGQGEAVASAEKTLDVITVYGHGGDAVQQAVRDWYDFAKAYDPDGTQMTNSADLPEIPNNYEYDYGCYTVEMVRKVDEIAGKYGLRLLDAPIAFQPWQNDIFLEETGIGSLLAPHSQASIRNMAGRLYPPYNFAMELQLLPEGSGKGIDLFYSYTRKDYFPQNTLPGSIDLADFAQWDAVAPDGTALLLALNSKGLGYIIAEQEQAMLVIVVYGSTSAAADQTITREELTELVQCFDYTIQPKEVDRSAVENRLREAESAQTFGQTSYGSYEEYLTENYVIADPHPQYTFYDVDGDGVQELLIGQREDGAFNMVLSLENGKVTQTLTTDTFLCENGIRESYEVPDPYWQYESHFYLVPDGNGGETLLDSVCRQGPTWYRCADLDGQNKQEITRETAEAIIARYPHLNLNWKPLLAYPLETQGVTLGEYLEGKDERVSEAVLLQIYRDYIAEQTELYYTHYRLLDINGDGITDLLLSGDGERYWQVLTYRYGSVVDLLSADFQLCADNVLDCGDEGGEIETHRFLRCTGFDTEILGLTAYNTTTAAWQSDCFGTPASEEEAKALLARYSHIDQAMRPVSELLK